jgi:diacylglycerol kinase
MDISSTLKNEIFRPLTMIVIPGAFALAPYVAVLAKYFPKFSEFMKSETNLFLVALLLATTAIGFILEDIGSRIEDSIDWLLCKIKPGRKEYWSEYLKLKTQDDYIGQRYLRTIYIRFKFELSMAPALAVCLYGLSWANQLTNTWSQESMQKLTWFIVAIIVYLLVEAYNSAVVLGTLHKSISQAVPK